VDTEPVARAVRARPLLDVAVHERTRPFPRPVPKPLSAPPKSAC